MRFLIFLFLLAGCPAVTTDKRPYQDEIVSALWHDLYGMTTPPPTIYWVAAFDWGHDVEGTALLGTGVLSACGDGCDWPITMTSLDHELLHYYHYRTTGWNEDLTHSERGWDQIHQASLTWDQMHDVALKLEYATIEAAQEKVQAHENRHEEGADQAPQGE